LTARLESSLHRNTAADPMSRSSAHSLCLQGRLGKWVIGATVVVLVAWLLEFATHSHLDDTGDGHSPNVAHLCGYCAAMQVGAGPVAVVVVIAPPSIERIESPTDESFSSSSAPSSYRSRAPPAA
jgi:hypothetical protein